MFADETPVGFVMLSEDSDKQEYVDRVRRLPGATELLSSYVPGDDRPWSFYLRYGFVETGEVEGAEHVIQLAL